MSKLGLTCVFALASYALSGCVPAPATIPSPQIPSPVPSVPSIPTPSDGMPSPTLPSPSLPSPSSDDSSSSMPSPLPSEGEETDSGDQASKGEEDGGEVVLEDSAGDGDNEGQEPEAGGGDKAESDSEDVSLEDTASDAESEPTFDEPTFEETSQSASTSRVVLDQETLEELERVLEQELGTFDSTINREQRNAEEQSAEPSTGPVPVIVFEEYPDGEQAEGSSGGGSGGGSGEGSSGGGEQNVSVAVENSQIPPPNPDDDIVARQLREAAIAEADPELKQRLWEEYYRYTGNQ